MDKRAATALSADLLSSSCFSNSCFTEFAFTFVCNVARRGSTRMSTPKRYKDEVIVKTRENWDSRIEVFRHFPRTANVKTSSHQRLAASFTVRSSHLYGYTTLQRSASHRKRFSHPKSSQYQVWEEILLFRTLSLLNYRIIFHRNIILKTISQLK